LAEKREKPISHIAKDLGINENVLYRWVHQARKAGSGIQVFPGLGKPRDEEHIRLRKDVKSLRVANEILKKAEVIFAQVEPHYRHISLFKRTKGYTLLRSRPNFSGLAVVPVINGQRMVFPIVSQKGMKNF
jgi:transposase